MNPERPTYVYRLVVTIPEGVDYSNPPQAWTDYMTELGAWSSPNPDAPEPMFFWPARRNFLSQASAKKHAERLRSYGAAVEIVRSLALQFA